MLNTWALQPIRTSQLILHAKNKTKMKLCCHVFLKAQCCSRRPVASKKTLKTPNGKTPNGKTPNGTHSLMMRGISCMQSNEAKYNHLNAQTVLKSSCTPPVQISSASMSADRAQVKPRSGKGTQNDSDVSMRHSCQKTLESTAENGQHAKQSQR